MGESIHTINSVPKTDRSYIRDTDKGLTRQQAYTVNKVESQIRNRKTEKGYIIGPDGNLIGESIKSSARNAKFRRSDLKKDSIVTHNHPTEGANSGQYGTFAGRIGIPLSTQDLKVAVERDLKEIRAVTPTYTYSMRRPKGGWGDTNDVLRAINRQEYENTINAQNYYYKQSSRNLQRQKEVIDRANVVTTYSGLKALAKRFGWEFTRRRVK